MRILLVTEGASDEPVAARLIRHALPDASVLAKRLPARGFAVVAREVEIWVRAAHFGHFDLLVIHFDLDDSISATFEDVSESKRWQEVRDAADKVLESLPQGGRVDALCVVLMSPCQSTEAWLAWGIENENGRAWEKSHRHILKTKLFGNPPRGLTRKAEDMAEKLIGQMAVNERWPQSLRNFMDHLRRGM
jgi:hypothetical protein